ncbi:hypothetical protein F3Y22_tig00000656pilonHSYRG00036 [Hibiscus syriacus]|uniref:Cupin type-1 domain-containing protein n=1 Tax=Hibiscus syriacus TaxID=106335 RepID=A0A6A3D2T3_HIBSY|nr:hypothetical protein F3Y22_tig00000656pilonHSYRG00036 [Hibiscus syriacus]
MVCAGDPDIISDFIGPKISPTLDGNFFNYWTLRGTFDAANPPDLKATKANMAVFPALNGTSVSFATLEYSVGTLNPPHIHPCAAELLIVVDGILKYNPSSDTPAMDVSAFVLVPSTVFATGIDDNILAKGFETNVPTIKKIKKGLGA